MANVSNSLGLDFDSEHTTTMQPDEPVTSSTDPSQGQDQVEDASASFTESSVEQSKPSKPVPYVNPERVNTGGPPRVKLSEQELEERMALRRKENEKRKERDLEVEKDRQAFEESQESERVKQAQSRQVQAQVNETRMKNAQNKMDKTESRLWDVDKPTRGWNHAKPSSSGPSAEGLNLPPSQTTGWPRGGSPRARGRGRGRGQARVANKDVVKGSSKESGEKAPAATASVPVPASSTQGATPVSRAV